MKKELLTLLVLLTIAHLLPGQSVIKGTLVDNSEGSPLEYASVALYTQSEDSLVTGSVTNAEGTFLLENIDKGEYYLLAQFMGYQQKRMGPFNISKDQVIDFGELSLEINQQMLEEIQVTGEMVTAIHKIDRQVFEADQFQTAQGGTASELLRNLPSVTMNANGEITARGVTGFVVLINGKPIQSDAQTFLNQIPANSVQNIEFITAPSAKYDPEGNAGIINIITIQSAAEGTFVQFNARLGAPSIEDYDNADNSQRYGSDFTLNHRKNSWDISFGASYLRNDINGRREGDVSTVVNDTIHRFPSDGERSFDETNYSASLTVGYTPDKNNNYSLGFYAGKRSKDRTADILYYDNHAIYEGNRIYTIQYFNENLRIRTSDFALGSFDYRHQFENKSSLTTSILYEYTLLGGPTTNRNLAWPNTEEVLQDEFNTNDNPLHGFRFQLDYAHKPVSVGLIEAGYQFRNLDHTGDFLYQRKNLESGIWELVPEFSSEVDLQRFIHSGYGQISGTKGSWNYAGGLRLEFMDRKLQLQDKAATVDTTYQYDFLKLYPSASLQYQVNDNLQLKAAYSKRVERTTTFKMNPFPEREHSETLEQGDPELLPEFIDLVEIGAVKYIQEQSIFATAYYRYTKNVVNRVNTVYNDTILNRIYSNVGNGEYLGLEFGSDLKLKNRWKAFLGGNIYYYKLRGFFDNRSVNNSSWIYSINANTTLRMDKGWSIQGTVNYLSSRVTAQGEDGRFFSPNLTVRKSFMNDRLAATLQWLNIDMGLWGANEQRITTSRPNEFFTTTNYVYEVDMVILNLSYTLKSGIKNKSRFIKSEFGEKEF